MRPATSRTSCRVSSETSSLSLKTRDTVATDTPASRATSLIVAIADRTSGERHEHGGVLLEPPSVPATTRPPRGGPGAVECLAVLTLDLAPRRRRRRRRAGGVVADVRERGAQRDRSPRADIVLRVAT